MGVVLFKIKPGATAISVGTVSQSRDFSTRTKLLASTQTLWCDNGKDISVYIDHQYAFAIDHIHGGLYRE